jgi:hypothetical protein
LAVIDFLGARLPFNRHHSRPWAIAGACLLLLSGLEAPAQYIPCTTPGFAVNGYSWIPLPRDYVEIDGLPGTVVVAGPGGCGNDTMVGIPLPPNLQFYFSGNNLWINAFMSVDGVLTNGPLPYPAPWVKPNEPMGISAGSICPWWDDLIMSLPDSKLLFRSDTDFFICEWKSLQLARTVAASGCSGSGSFSFQVKVYSNAHPTLPNHIEFHYGPHVPPVTMPCDPAIAATDSGYLPSASVGICGYWNNTPIGGNEGTDPTDRGAANIVFPTTDYRFAPLIWDGAEGEQFFTWTQVPQEPFCSIEGLPGTNSVGPSCAPEACYSRGDSSWYDGALIPVPWKMSLEGRAVQSVSMNAEGQLRLGPGRFSNADYNTWLPATSPTPGPLFAFLAPFWDSDLQGGPDTRMLWRVDGLPGCRIMTFEWLRFHDFSGSFGSCTTGSGSLSFQVKLFEGYAGAYAPSGCPHPPVWGQAFDRIEFLYDHAAFVAGNFTATICAANHDTNHAAQVLGSPFLNAPAPGMKWVIRSCDVGTLRHFGEPTTNAPPGLQQQLDLAGNGVPPNVGNAWGINVTGGTPGGQAILLVGPGNLVTSTGSAAPCGGVEFGPIRAWVNPLSSSTLVFGLGTLAGTSTSDGCTSLAVPIPFSAALVGQAFHLQAASAFTSGPAIYVEATQAMRVIIGQ